MAETIPTTIICTLRPGTNEISQQLYPEPEPAAPGETPGEPTPDQLELAMRVPDVTLNPRYTSDVFAMYTPGTSVRSVYHGTLGTVSTTLKAKDPDARREGYRQLVTEIEQRLGAATLNATGLKIAII